MSQPVDRLDGDCSSPSSHATSAAAALPDTLQRRIADAHAELRRTGFVRIWYRQALYAALGPRHPDREATIIGNNRTLGHRRRTLLALYTLERILPITCKWQRDKPITWRCMTPTTNLIPCPPIKIAPEDCRLQAAGEWRVRRA